MRHCNIIYNNALILLVKFLGQKCNETLIAPVNGTVQCTGEQITNESCHFGCNPGFEIHESSVRTCLADHTWAGIEPYCVIKNCDALARPWNGYILSHPCLTEFKSKCHVECVEGYYIATGERDTYQECLADPTTNTMYWSDPPDCTCKFDSHIYFITVFEHFLLS